MKNPDRMRNEASPTLVTWTLSSLKCRWFEAVFSREFALVMLFAGFALTIGWVGFVGSDDQYYYSAALKWLEGGWYLPDHFGRIRNSVSVPISWSIWLFGDYEYSVVLPSVAYYLATLVLTFLCLSRFADRTTALVACMLFSTFPVVVSNATQASSDIAEIFWASVAFWLFFYAWQRKYLRAWALFGCGVAMALAFSGRETVIALGLFVAGAILLGGRIGRAQIAWVAAGGLAILGAEAVYYAIAGGDPLLRLSLFLQGASDSNDRSLASPFSVDESGAFRVHPLLDPLLLVLARHGFGLAYWVFFAVLLLSLKKQRDDRTNSKAETRELMVLALCAGAVWFVFVAVALFRIKLLQRYYIAPAWFMTVGLAAYLCVHRVKWSHPRGLWLTTSALVAVNLAGIALQNNNPKFVERQLVALAKKSSEPIFTDPYTAYYAAEFLHWAGVPPGRVKGGPPSDGALFFLVSSRIEAPNRLTPMSMLPALQLRPEWSVEQKIDGPKALPQFMVTVLHATPLLPEWLKAKLTAPRGSILLVRSPGSRANTEKSE